MQNLTSPRSSGIKTGYWSPAKKDDLVQRMGPIEERAEGLISNTCDHFCVFHVALTTQDELDRQCANCPLAKLYRLIYPN